MSCENCTCQNLDLDKEMKRQDRLNDQYLRDRALMVAKEWLVDDDDHTYDTTDLLNVSKRIYRFLANGELS